MEFAPLSEGKIIFGQDQKESEFNTNSGDEVLQTLEMSNQIVKHLGPILNSLEGVKQIGEDHKEGGVLYSQWAALEIRIQLSAVFAICVQTFSCLCTLYSRYCYVMYVVYFISLFCVCLL